MKEVMFEVKCWPAWQSAILSSAILKWIVTPVPDPQVQSQSNEIQIDFSNGSKHEFNNR